MEDRWGSPVLVAAFVVASAGFTVRFFSGRENSDPPMWVLAAGIGGILLLTLAIAIARKRLPRASSADRETTDRNVAAAERRKRFLYGGVVVSVVLVLVILQIVSSL